MRSEPEEQGRILVVDDDDASRRGYELLLRMAGYSVATSHDGDEALDRLHAESFDVVISDVNMPNLDGFELTRQLRAETATRDLPIILISAMANSNRKVKGLDRGADDFLAKPVDVDELLARIRVHLRHNSRNKELIEQSRYDSVTGVLNRGAIEAELDRELKRMDRTGLPLSVLMLDIDNFKGFNDRYGHTVGDDALHAVAGKLEKLLRVTDLVGRYGGDELLAILPDTDLESASLLIDRIMIEWKRHPPIPHGTSEPVLVSVGAATALEPVDATTLIQRADARMYDAKRAGRWSGSPR